MRLVALIEKWRDYAEQLRRVGARVDGAALCDALVSDLQALGTTPDDEWIPLADAVATTGFSAQHLRRLAHAGRVRSQRRAGILVLAVVSLPKKAKSVAEAAPSLHLLGATTEQVVRESVGATTYPQ
jgi:hypothetical protein